MVNIETKQFWGTSIHIVEEDGCGIVKISIRNNDIEECVITDLCVHPSRRQQGYATRLMQETTKTAHDKGCRRMIAWTERGSWVQEWLRRIGFCEDESEPAGIGNRVCLIKYLTLSEGKQTPCTA